MDISNIYLEDLSMSQFYKRDLPKILRKNDY